MTSFLVSLIVVCNYVIRASGASLWLLGGFFCDFQPFLCRVDNSNFGTIESV